MPHVQKVPAGDRHLAQPSALHRQQRHCAMEARGPDVPAASLRPPAQAQGGASAGSGADGSRTDLPVPAGARRGVPASFRGHRQRGHRQQGAPGDGPQPAVVLRRQGQRWVTALRTWGRLTFSKGTSPILI